MNIEDQIQIRHTLMEVRGQIDGALTTLLAAPVGSSTMLRFQIEQLQGLRSRVQRSIDLTAVPDGTETVAPPIINGDTPWTS